MYTTFCSSYRFFAKLVERYHVPESVGFSEGALRELHHRICDILAHWLSRRYFDLDTFTKDKISVFISGTLLRDGYTEEAKKLQQIIDQKLEEATQMSKELFQPLPDVHWGKITTQSLYDVFLSSNEEVIAQQLTLHDWNIYRRIRVSSESTQSKLLDLIMLSHLN